MKPPLTILEGEVLARLRKLPDESVQCVVTSPPYWGLRDYGIPPRDWLVCTFVPVAGLPPLEIPAMRCVLGMESDPWAFVAHQVQVFREVQRVLRRDGTCWVNMGDSYAGSGQGFGDKSENPNKGHRASSKGVKLGSKHGDSGHTCWKKPSPGLKAKDLCGIPWRVAQALQADGWWLRQDIIWAKPNPMPESTQDRCTKAHEYLFLLTKSPRYRYDAAAIRTASVSFETMDFNRRSTYFDGRAAKPSRIKMPAGWDTAKGGHGSFHRNGREKGKVRGHAREHEGLRDTWDDLSKAEQQAMGANKRSVWTVATAPYKEAHFATFPPELITPCILAGSRPGDVVLDPFLGSGTTALVSLWHGRQAVGIELNAEYAALARARCEPSELARTRLAALKQELEPLPLFAGETKETI